MFLLVGAAVGFGLSTLVALATIGNSGTDWGERFGMIAKTTFGFAILGGIGTLLTGL
jgi:hypothetical protein